MARSPRSSDIWPTPRRPWDAGLRDRIGVARDSVAFVSKRLAGTLLVWLLIGIALALPAALYLLDRNLAGAAGDWRGTHGFSVYFQVGVDAQVPAEFARRLADDADIKTVRLITPDEALAELRLHLGANDALEALGDNPLPATVRAVAKPDVPVTRLERLAARLKAQAGVDAVVVEKAWLERLAAIRTLVRRAAGMVAALLGVGAVLISSATVRLAVLVRLTELQVRALVGASVRFMRRPFLYLGVIYGFGGGVVAAMLLAAALAWLEAPLRRLFASYGAEAVVVGFDGAFVLALLGIGVVLGAFGAVLACRARLRELDLA